MIGLCWERGGADWFIRHFKYPTAEYVGEGDISGLDVSLHKALLELYKAMSSMYLDFESMDPEDVSLWKRLHHFLISNLAVKLIPTTDKSWTWMIGKMPSGDWDTSHGDSWIMLLLFCMFLAKCIRDFPALSVAIKTAWIEDDINFPVYGDDHNIIVQKMIIAMVVNEIRFAQFLNEAFGIKVRSIREYKGVGKFLAEPDTRYTGDVDKVGVRFLQRQFFLDQESQQYMCTRDGISVMYKLFHNPNHNDLIDKAASAVGVVMDSMGTNQVVYDLCSEIYNWIKVVSDNTETYDRRVFLKLAEDKYFANKLEQRLGLKISQLVPGFPSICDLKARQIGVYRFKEPHLAMFNEYDDASWTHKF